MPLSVGSSGTASCPPLPPDFLSSADSSQQTPASIKHSFMPALFSLFCFCLLLWAFVMTQSLLETSQLSIKLVQVCCVRSAAAKKTGQLNCLFGQSLKRVHDKEMYLELIYSSSNAKGFSHGINTVWTVESSAVMKCCKISCTPQSFIPVLSAPRRGRPNLLS